MIHDTFDENWYQLSKYLFIQCYGVMTVTTNHHILPNAKRNPNHLLICIGFEFHTYSILCYIKDYFICSLKKVELHLTTDGIFLRLIKKTSKISLRLKDIFVLQKFVFFKKFFFISRGFGIPYESILRQ